MNDFERFLAELEVMTNRARELEPKIALCLYVLLGSIKANHLREFNEVCIQFAEQARQWLQKEGR